eukprot:FR735814.1.p1 GENE.FR735814.1~~FR735814.1.p1  ORF type:complete len:190 (+),score=19.46 FR735814.1:34-570(+)
MAKSKDRDSGSKCDDGDGSSGDGSAVEEVVEVEVDKDHGEGLKSAKPMPDWLACLVCKYASESGMSVQRSGAVVDSLGRFALFLSCCIFNKLPLTAKETDSMLCLIEASNDGTGFRLDSIQTTTSSNEAPDQKTAVDQPRTQKYWAYRMWRFLKNIRELKAVPKDEKFLQSGDLSVFL